MTGEPRRRRRGGLWLALALIVVALGAGAGVVLAMSGDDTTTSESTVATTDPTGDTTGDPTTTAAAGTERCVRQDIDFAALREGPDRTTTQLDRIPAGTCHLPVTDRVRGPGGADWLRVTYNGIEGYSAESNFLAADVDPGAVTTAPASTTTAAETTTTNAETTTIAAETTTTAAETTTTSSGGLVPGDGAPALRDLVEQYFQYVNDGNLTAAWDLLSENQQKGFGSFDGFTKVWMRVPHVDIVEFSGCTAADAPAFCHFIADYTTAKGGIRRSQVLFEVVYVGAELKVNSSSVDFLRCVKKNQGENGCSVS